ncbi:MAG: hypothetical protein AB7O24_23205 [Kofleriaceae bacterium]
MHCCRHAIVVLVLACSCGKSAPDANPPPPSTGSGSAQPAAPAGQLTLLVGDKPVATLDLAKVASWPRLDTLVPSEAARMGTWQSITIKGQKPAPVELNRPSENYRDYVPALFPGDGGGISFGMFDPVELGKKGKPALREDKVVELRLTLAEGSGRGENDHQGGAATDPADLKLTIKTVKGEQVITGTKLLELPREAPPDGGDAKGWKLTAVLASAGITKFEKIVVSGAENVSIPLERADLDDKTSIPFIKLNRQGSLRFRVFKRQGDNWRATADLRNLSLIDVVK